ncbi:tripartite motif-containing protein 44 [Poecilia latipinna]|uniref:Tripartite motif containing 44 n=2 Tax=Poecilia TaxID=8080 RepID=A0A087Y6V1_POEFO|nr:PREDICTED: tripartite motif-containing protein 44 [Poecilia formosa]XP_014907446.1 PREDICTED: tripartite motif-containing protein 44 [Poecilia latipinna]
MDHKDESLEGATGLSQDDLPQMDGSCDACEPDEAQPATHVCHICSFAFCPIHADRHSSSTRHTLMPYNGEGAQACGLDTDSDSRVEGAAEDESGEKRAAQVGENQDLAEGGEVVHADGEKNAQNEGKVGEEAEAAAAGEAGKRDMVTVERLRCKEHGQEGSLYCKPDEQIICVVCAVQGEHRDHEIITLHEAYVWQKSRQGHDLLGYTQQMAENVKTKWTNPEMSTEELEEYVSGQFDELRRLVRLEERRTLHLVDLKEAFLTASAAEKIAEITLETEKLQEEMDNITHQLCLLEQAEAQGVGPAAVAEVLAAKPGPVHRLLHDIEARPRVPEPRANPMDPRDLEDNDSGPSMDHAP